MAAASSLLLIFFGRSGLSPWPNPTIHDVGTRRTTFITRSPFQTSFGAAHSARAREDNTKCGGQGLGTGHDDANDAHVTARSSHRSFVAAPSSGTKSTEPLSFTALTYPTDD